MLSTASNDSNSEMILIRHLVESGFFFQWHFERKFMKQLESTWIIAFMPGHYKICIHEYFEFDTTVIETGWLIGVWKRKCYTFTSIFSQLNLPILKIKPV